MFIPYLVRLGKASKRKILAKNKCLPYTRLVSKVVFMDLDLRLIPTFGVAGNFTGHLEQAGEAMTFAEVKVNDPLAPKALFPTYIPLSSSSNIVPSFLNVFPFDSEKIIFPFDKHFDSNKEKLQIESECAIVFDVEWKNDLVSSLSPVCFCASNDCSIRKEGKVKISTKKNWGKLSKGLSKNMIPLTSFSKGCVLDKYHIASFLIRNGSVQMYGEDSPVNGYNYMYETLTEWMIQKLNYQKDEGPTEDIHSYLLSLSCPNRILVSIGATRYTEYGRTVFLQDKDRAVIVLYPCDKYSLEDVKRIIEKNKGETLDFSEDVSALSHSFIMEK